MSRNYTEPERLAIFKATTSHISSLHEELGIRKDRKGNEIMWARYGDRDSVYGWEVDHVIALANGGSDHISNLQALQWKANVEKSDKPSPTPVLFFKGGLYRRASTGAMQRSQLHVGGIRSLL